MSRIVLMTVWNVALAEWAVTVAFTCFPSLRAVRENWPVGFKVPENLYGFLNHVESRFNTTEKKPRFYGAGIEILCISFAEHYVAEGHR